MDVGWVDDRNFKTGLARLQACCGGDTPGTCTNDDNLKAGVAGIGRGFPAVDDPPHDTCHIIPCRFGCSQDVSQAALSSLGKRPQGCGPCTCATISQHGAGQFGQCRVEFDRILIHDLA